MKKFLVVLIFLIFSSLGANADTSVRYMAGAPISVSYGGSPHRSFAYYNNRPINHANRIYRQYPPMGMGVGTRYSYGIPTYRTYYPSYYYRQYNNPQDPQYQPNNGQIANTYKTVSRTAEVSRLSKNYNIQPAKKYTRGNVTYYN